MLLATIVLGLADSLDVQYQGDIVGVDRGCLKVINDKQPLDLAIGDFDTVNDKELKKIKKYAKKFIQLNPVKDESDFELALEYCTHHQIIHVYGGLGGRLDHELVNLRYVMADTRLIIHDQKNRMFSLLPGTHRIEKDNFKYLSILAISKSKLSISGVQYPLDERILNTDEHYTLSNEIVEESADLTLHNGRLLIVQSND